MSADTTSIVALAAAVAALGAIVACAILAVRLRRVRADQRVILGAQGGDDLVAHAAGLSQAFGALRAYVEEATLRLDGRLGTAEDRMDHALAYRALLRYDAYNELSGRQSSSIALLDAMGSGLVLSSIHHRDQARLYVKQVHEGVSEAPLSPEEAETVRMALAGETQRLAS